MFPALGICFVLRMFLFCVNPCALRSGGEGRAASMPSTGWPRVLPQSFKFGLVTRHAPRLYASAETWPSGRRRSPAKGVGPEGSRGFESLRLRHFTANPLIINDTDFQEGRNPRPGTVYWYRGPRMATTPRLVTRGRTFYFRASVPQDLWDVTGRKEVKISLRTAERSLAQLRCRVFSNHVDLVVKEARRMGQGQDAAIDQAIRDYFRDALDWGQEFADIFAPDGEVDVDDCISTLEARLAEHRRRLVV